MNKIQAKRVEAYELIGPDGKKIGMYRVRSEWQGCVEMVNMASDETVIAMKQDPSSFLSDVFDRITGIATTEDMVLLKASPSFHGKLSAAAPPIQQEGR